MTPSEIITADCQKHNVDAQKVLNYVAALIKTKKAYLLQNSNSVLLVVMLSNKDAELHLFTADQPVSLIKAVRKFIGQIKTTKLDRVYGKSDDPQVHAMLQHAGVDVEKADKPQFSWMANV